MVQGDYVNTIYYCCKNKRNFGYTAKIRVAYYLKREFWNSFTTGDHFDDCLKHNASKSFAIQNRKIILEEIKKYHDFGITRARDIYNLMKVKFLDL